MDHEQAMKVRESVSALADGQLFGRDFARTVESVASDEDAQATWQTYHLIGDVLRGGEHIAYRANPAFLSRFQERMQAEASLAAAPVAVASDMAVAAAAVQMNTEPANDANFRWKLVAGVASLAAVVAVGWSVVSGVAPSDRGAQLAQVPTVQQTQVAGAQPSLAAASQTVEKTVTLASGESQVMIRDPRLDELLAAHKQFGGTSALQMPAGFLRNATFEAPSR